ncbi:MAG: hypothetical protein U1F49_09815 [Rubrivivax sp.]
MRTMNAAALALLARIQAGEKIPVVRLVELMFAVPERYCTAGAPVVWASSTWLPLGLAIEAVEDTAGEMPALTLAVPAVKSSAQISLALTQPVAGTAVRIYEALVDPATGVVADALLSWSGELGVPGVEDSPRATITVLAEHRGTVATRSRPTATPTTSSRRLYERPAMLKFDPALDAAPLAWPAASYFRRRACDGLGKLLVAGVLRRRDLFRRQLVGSCWPRRRSVSPTPARTCAAPRTRRATRTTQAWPIGWRWWTCRRPGARTIVLGRVRCTSRACVGVG